MPLRRIWALVPAIAVVVVAVGVSTAAVGPYNTTDPTVYAPTCQNALHRGYKHCLNGTTTGGVTLRGNTHTIDLVGGGTYKFSIDAPPHCKGALKAGQAPCTIGISWGSLYGASLADWGINVQDTIEPHTVSGCLPNDLTCDFTVGLDSQPGPPLQNGTALRVTAVADVYGLACGHTAVGYCAHWVDWRLRLHSSTPTLDVDWTMPARLSDARAKTWSESKYGVGSGEYVDPSGWKVNLFVADDGHATCPEGVTFKWTLSGQGQSETLPGDGCKVTATVKKLGTYSVTAEELKGGKPDGTNATNTKVVVRDWLVVGLGDSNGSGQGSPPYLYEQCDRSPISYQYQAAQYLEDHDPRSSVTFLWAACSGARSDQLWRNTYEGQEPGKGSNLPPQLDQITGSLAGSGRKIDAVVMSVGINDLYFGAIMAFCTTYDAPLSPALTDKSCEAAHVEKRLDPQGYVGAYSQSGNFALPTLAQETADRLKELPTAFRLLDDRLNKLGAAHIFATQYPDETTDAAGKLCNENGPRPRLPATVWGWLQQVGGKLNSAVAATSSLGWTPVTGIPQDFIGHGYCSSDSYFRTVVGSATSQLNAFGSFHATADGQAITFRHTRERVCHALYGNTTCDGDPPAAN